MIAESVSLKDGTGLEIEVERLLRQIRISGKLRGLAYLTAAICRNIRCPGSTDGITKGLYPEIARMYGTTPSRVERSIRHAIEVSWTQGGRPYLEQIAGYTMSRRPSNAMFIDLISFHFRCK